MTVENGGSASVSKMAGRKRRFCEPQKIDGQKWRFCEPQKLTVENGGLHIFDSRLRSLAREPIKATGFLSVICQALRALEITVENGGSQSLRKMAGRKRRFCEPQEINGQKWRFCEPQGNGQSVSRRRLDESVFRIFSCQDF